jgi:hypothetical protein
MNCGVKCRIFLKTGKRSNLDNELGLLAAGIIRLLSESKVCLAEGSEDRYSADKMVLVCQIVIARLIVGLPKRAHEEMLEKTLQDLPIIFDVLKESTPELGELTEIH